MDPLPEILSGTFGIVVLLIALFLTVAAILMPVAVLLIHSLMVKQNKILESIRDSENILHQTKLLAEIRDALRSMEAVGIEETPHEPEHALPLTRGTPSSVPPERERLRR